MLLDRRSGGEKNDGVVYDTVQQPAGQVEAQLIQDSPATDSSSESPSISAKKQRSWSQRLNPLKTKYVPLVPEKRQPSLEAEAGFFSRLFFTWVTPLMQVGYQRPLEQNDIWEVNPERSAEVLEVKFRAAFQRHTQNGSSRPLLRALLSTFKREFVLGALCQLSSTVASTVSPFLLRYLIAFATQAYNAAQHRDGSAPPNIGYGVGLVVVITCLQIIMTLSINHFLYFGMTVGGEARAVLMSVIFDKAMRISGRAKAGGGGGGGGDGPSDDAALPPSDVEPGSEEERKWYEKLLRKRRGRRSSPRKGGVEIEEAGGWGNGRIVNLMSTDTYRIDQASGFFHLLWGSPLTIIITMVLLLINLTYSALPGLGLLFICTPVLGLAFKALFQRRFAINKITDARVSLTQEVLQSMRFVKLFGWETSFLRRINEIRKKEIRSIQILLLIRDGIQAVAMSLPVFASMLSFITFSLSSHTLNPAPIFSSLALFNNLRMPLNLLPRVIGQAVDALASVRRIQEFLLAEESTDDARYDYAGQNAITVEDATFTWEQTMSRARARERLDDDDDDDDGAGGAGTPSTLTMVEPFQIPHLNLTVGRSELVAVIGSVGSGKTSLLAALAGDMRQTGGCVTLGATRAFCPQYAWIQNASVRDNILFGRDFDREWYDRVVEACALRTDFEMLPDGDRTEIGERGITVSGGQKQRINIARAIYFNADIVLMDDPLSAVDTHVGKQIMDKAICGLLSNKCRILATHQLHILNRSDRIIWLDEGHIKAQGSYEHLMAENEEFEKLMTLTHVDEQTTGLPLEGPHDASPSTSGGDDDDDDDDDDDKGVGREEEKMMVKIEKTHKSTAAAALMQAEERALNAVSWSVYGAYIKASGSILVAPLVVGFLVVAQGCNIMTSLWLSWWTADRFSKEHVTQDTYIAVYAGLGVAQALLMFCFAVSISVFGTRASKVMLGRAMTKVLGAPMSFFDTTPLGRITNRFSKDIDVMDNALTDSLRMYLLTISMLLSTMALILAYYYYFAAALVPLLCVFVFSAGYYRSSAREIKRHEAVLRSHVFAKFSEAVYGTSTIRAYGLQRHFSAVLRRQIDDFDGAYFLTFGNQRWLSLRLDAIGLVIIFVLGMLVVTSRFTVDPSIGGLVLSYMLGIMGQFQFAVRQMAEVENDMNSTERIHCYGTSLEEEEAPQHVGDGPPESWPSRGEIVFDHVQMRYRAGLPLVLKDIHMHIKGGERLGVVGRTGAGKSSIMSTLFRLVEISGGSITIDGVNISTIGLQDLRSRLAIIPQDPTLFRGTVRSNLDPFDEHSDAELWSALRQANLVGVASTEDETPGAGAAGAASSGLTLHSAVEEEGLNFSLGQRQLMALARALVRDAKIIVCDEATSSVDFATDQKVQRTMESFRGKTLLCIAHRLKTIIGYDRICVMDQGAVAELGTPLELFDRGGIFTGMCEKGGIQREDILKKAAAAAAAE